METESGTETETESESESGSMTMAMNIAFKTLSRAYAEQLGRLFVNADDLGFVPARPLLFALGLGKDDIYGHADVISEDAAEAAADRSKVIVEAL